MLPIQPPLFPSLTGKRIYDVPFPSTRFQGSKRKLVDWIWEQVQDLHFDSVLDVFGGTGSVSHLFKTAGKQVIYNDNLAFNWEIGYGLIQNAEVRLTPEDIETLLVRKKDVNYPSFIQSTFQNIYFTDEENAWLDYVLYNINHDLENPFKRALALFAIFQACLIKRPYNLFHRANLYMRQAEVKRSFGNKITWDTPFPVHFRTFAHEANAAVFDNQRANQALNLDALQTPTGADLVYLDPPYLNRKGVGVDYRDFYHFLEGMVNYADWGTRIDNKSKHKRLRPQPSPFNQADRILSALEAVISRHRHSLLVISYRDDGIPAKATLIELLKSYKTQVQAVVQAQKYALANKGSHELLLIAT